MSAEDRSRFDSQAMQGAAALDYEYACARYWSFVSLRALALAEVGPRMSVLDVGCGTGAATLPAAQRVGPAGRVVAVDYSPEMLALASEKASYRSLINIRWLLDDITTLELPPEQFDAVVFVLGLFAVEDMAGLAARLWRLVRPGGRLVVATLGQQVFEPMQPLFLAEARKASNGMTLPQPWLRTNTVAEVARVLDDAGVAGAQVTEETATVPLAEAGDWWRIVLGSELSRTAQLLDRAAAGRVEAANLRAIAEMGVAELTSSYVYGVGTKA